MSANPLLYEKVAGLVETQISNGALRARDRLPSVRSMSKTARVSISTVVQAYVHLENIGLIEARPQSGFYVRAPGVQRFPEPRARVTRSLKPRSVSTEVMDTCLETFQTPGIVQLHGAFTAASIYPNRRLNNLIREVLRDEPEHAGHLVMPPGDEELRRQIARRMASCGAATNPDHVVITGGTMDAITLSLRVLCRAGDTVLVESPTYFGILQTIEHLGLRVVEVPNHPAHGIDVEAVRNAVRNARLSAAVLMPSCNNPTGSVTSDDNKREIVAALTHAAVPIIEDDVYGDLHHAGVRPRVMRAFDESGTVITCGSVSKTIALGYRIGWAVSPQFHAEIQRAKFFSSVAAPTLQQRVLARYYASGGYDRYLRGVRREITTNTYRFIDAIARHFPAGTRVGRPSAGMVSWVELPNGVDGLELFRAALASRIGIVPGVVFSAKGDYRNYVRLNCGLPWNPALERVVEKLGRMISSLS